MAPARILIVEDESVVAEDIRRKLLDLGYEVLDIAFTGADSVRLAGSDEPDLVLMDISLQGSIDGIEAARMIDVQYDIPVVFLTAFSDRGTIEGAKETRPYGFMLKPFTERELHVAIEMALHRKEVERSLRRSRRVLATALDGIDHGVIATDEEGLVSYMNSSAERLTGWSEEDARGRALTDVFTILDGSSRQPIDLSLEGALGVATGRVLLRRRDNTENLIEDSIAPIADDDGAVSGVVLIFRDVGHPGSGGVEEGKRPAEGLRAPSGGAAYYLRNILAIIAGEANLARMELPEGWATPRLQRIAARTREGDALLRRLLGIRGGADEERGIEKLAAILARKLP
jgi:PAS domain S-box-containing protein